MPLTPFLAIIRKDVQLFFSDRRAVIMAFEYAPREKRGFYACFPQIGLAIGLALSTAVVAVLTYTLPDEAFLSWGWRIAFLLSIVLVGNAAAFIPQPPATASASRPWRSCRRFRRWKKASSYIACTDRAISWCRRSSGAPGARAGPRRSISAGE